MELVLARREIISEIFIETFSEFVIKISVYIERILQICSYFSARMHSSIVNSTSGRKTINTIVFKGDSCANDYLFHSS